MPFSILIRPATGVLIFAMNVAAILAFGRDGIFIISCWRITICMFLRALINASVPRFGGQYELSPTVGFLFILMLMISLPEISVIKPVPIYSITQNNGTKKTLRQQKIIPINASIPGTSQFDKAVSISAFWGSTGS